MAHISFVLSLHRFHHICNITLHCVLVVVDVGVAIGVVDDDVLLMMIMLVLVFLMMMMLFC